MTLFGGVNGSFTTQGPSCFMRERIHLFLEYRFPAPDAYHSSLLKRRAGFATASPIKRHAGCLPPSSPTLWTDDTELICLVSTATTLHRISCFMPFVANRFAPEGVHPDAEAVDDDNANQYPHSMHPLKLFAFCLIPKVHNHTIHLFM